VPSSWHTLAASSWNSHPARWFARDALAELFSDSVEFLDDLCCALRHDEEAAASGLAVTSLAASVAAVTGIGAPAALTLAAMPPLLMANREGMLEEDTYAAVLAPPRPVAESADSSTNLLEALFPGYFEGSAIMRLSCLQIAFFGGCLVIAGSMVIPSTCTLYLLGAGWGPDIASGHVWRLVSPIFLHASFPHIITNTLFQLRLGYKVERFLGGASFTKLYLLSGVFGNLVSVAQNPFKLSVGASTSGMGILGATVASLGFEANMSSTSAKATLVSSGLILAAINISEHADVYGHLGGFFAGMLLTPLLTKDQHIRLSSSAAAEPGDLEHNMLLQSRLRGAACCTLALSTAAACVRIFLFPSDNHVVLHCPEFQSLFHGMANSGTVR